MKAEDEVILAERPYVYSDLVRSKDIRTVTITRVTQDLIECVLQTQAVAESGYAALSYVWGSEDKPFRILVRHTSGKVHGHIAITRNLDQAMRDLWASPDVVDRTFWIDQICINQDGAEKNDQVAMMGDIFLHADCVLTYAGPEKADATQRNRGVELLKILREHFAPNFEMLSRDGYGRSTTFPNFPVQGLSAKIVSSVSEADWQWLVGLCFGEYVTRLWIVQEQTLNQNLQLVQGRHVYDWNEVTSIALLWYFMIIPFAPLAQYWRTNPSYRGLSHDYVIQSILTIWNKRNFGRSIEHAPKLMDNIRVHGFYLRCRDPRDRIYALLSLSADTAELGIDIDYSKSPAQIFHQTSVVLLRADVWSIDMLSWTCRRDNLADDGIPSWAIRNPRPILLSANSSPPGLYAVHPKRPLTRQLQFRENDSVLVARGRIITCVTRSVQPFYISESMILEWWDESCMRSMIEVSEMLAATLTADEVNKTNVVALFYALQSGGTLSDAGQFSGAELHHLYCLLRDLSRPRDAEWPKPALEYLPDQAQQEYKSRMRGPLDFISSIGRMLDAEGICHSSVDEPATPEELITSQKAKRYNRFNGRAFCMTDSGALCTVGNVAHKGDVIATIEGSDRFWALRPASPATLGVSMRYRIVGDAWVYGMMHGEAYAGLNPDIVDGEIELI